MKQEKTNQTIDLSVPYVQLDFFQFRNEFANSMYINNFSIGALMYIYDNYEEMTGGGVLLKDKICEEWKERTKEDVKQEWGKSIEELKEATEVIEIENDGKVTYLFNSQF